MRSALLATICTLLLTTASSVTATTTRTPDGDVSRLNPRFLLCGIGIGIFCNRQPIYQPQPVCTYCPLPSWQSNGWGRDGYGYDGYGNRLPYGYPPGFQWFGSNYGGWCPPYGWNVPSPSWRATPHVQWAFQKARWWSPNKSWSAAGVTSLPAWWAKTSGNGTEPVSAAATPDDNASSGASIDLSQATEDGSSNKTDGDTDASTPPPVVDAARRLRHRAESHSKRAFQA